MHASVGDGCGHSSCHTPSGDDEAASRDFDSLAVSACAHRSSATPLASPFASNCWAHGLHCNRRSQESCASICSAQKPDLEWQLRCLRMESVWKHEPHLGAARPRIVEHAGNARQRRANIHQWAVPAAIAIFFILFDSSAANFMHRESSLQTPRSNRGQFTSATHDSAHMELNRHLSNLKSMEQDELHQLKLQGHLQQLRAIAQNKEEEAWSHSSPVQKARHGRGLESNMGKLSLDPTMQARRSKTPDSLVDFSTTTPCATPELRGRSVLGYFDSEEEEEDEGWSMSDAVATPRQPSARQLSSSFAASVSGSSSMTGQKGASAVVCFDFDKTLSAEHVHNLCESSRAGMAGVDLVKAFGGAGRLQRLRDFLGQLRRGGAALYIVSRGARGRILQALQATGLSACFRPEAVVGWEELRAAGHADKGACAAALGRSSGVSAERVVLVDDDEEQLWGLDWDGGGGRGLQGCEGYWVEGARGLTSADMAAIVDMVERAGGGASRRERRAEGGERGWQ